MHAYASRCLLRQKFYLPLSNFYLPMMCQHEGPITTRLTGKQGFRLTFRDEYGFYLDYHNLISIKLELRADSINYSMFSHVVLAVD